MGDICSDFYSREPEFNPAAVIGHNAPPPEELVFAEINDLYDTAKDFCDGEAIADAATADAVTKIMQDIHAAGKKADELRVVQKEPHLKASRAVDALFKPSLDKVKLGKDACAALLAPWRTKLAREAAELAAAIKAEAERKTAEAQAAMQASAGNLAEREAAEYAVKEAKALTAQAKRADAAPTGLVTRWVAEMTDASAALEWAYGRDATRFNELAQEMANEAVRHGVRVIPGFVVRDEKVARV